MFFFRKKKIFLFSKNFIPLSKTKKMKQLDYIYIDKWFAWKPVKTINFGWVWLKKLTRIIDERPLVYLGLLTEVTYIK